MPTIQQIETALDVLRDLYPDDPASIELRSKLVMQAYQRRQAEKRESSCDA